MKTLQDQIVKYASYHRDARNIATHFVGIPLIVLAITTLLSRPAVEVAGVPLTAALFVITATGLYYLLLHAGLGLLMCALLALTLPFGSWIAGLSTTMWLSVGIGLFAVGWVFQFVGHGLEGRKPAFVDDLVGLIIGPLFVVVEGLFAMGLLQSLRVEVENRAGPTRTNRERASS